MRSRGYSFSRGKRSQGEDVPGADDQLTDGCTQARCKGPVQTDSSSAHQSSSPLPSRTPRINCDPTSNRLVQPLTGLFVQLAYRPVARGQTRPCTNAGRIIRNNRWSRRHEAGQLERAADSHRVCRGAQKEAWQLQTAIEHPHAPHAALRGHGTGSRLFSMPQHQFFVNGIDRASVDLLEMVGRPRHECHLGQMVHLTRHPTGKLMKP